MKRTEAGGGWRHGSSGDHGLREAVSGAFRPAVFAWPFWAALAATYARRAFDFFGEEWRFGLGPVTASAFVLAAAWAALPWEPGASARRKLVVPAFLLAVFAFSQLTGSDWALILYLIAFANAVFVFGPRLGVPYGAVVAAAVFADAVLSHAQGIGLAEAALSSVALAPLVLLVVGACAAIVATVREREEARSLLGELRKAHAELEEYAGKVRALTISEERTRLSREIHDSLGHHLTAAKLQLEHARRFRERDPEGAWEEVEESKELILGALAEVRRSVRALRPLALEESAGPAAFAALVRSFEGTGPEVSFGIEGEERELPPEAELILYRAMQEGLTNALKHSGARRVRATLSFGARNARVAIADDGGGMSTGGAAEGGFGLAALSERARRMGGTLKAGDARNGFLLEVEVPAPRAAGPEGAPS